MNSLLWSRVPGASPGASTTTITCPDPFIVGRNLDRPGIIRLQHLQQRRRGHPADGEFLRAIEELAPADPAVHVSIEQV
jgi:hypothetical protein